jgi:hypothetical protein
LPPLAHHGGRGTRCDASLSREQDQRYQCDREQTEGDDSDAKQPITHERFPSGESYFLGEKRQGLFRELGTPSYRGLCKTGILWPTLGEMVVRVDPCLDILRRLIATGDTNDIPLAEGAIAEYWEGTPPRARKSGLLYMQQILRERYSQ